MYNILLVDDEQNVLDALSAGSFWKQLGVDKLLTASDGTMALNILKEQHIDLLITDICMPKMNGLSLLASARTILPDIHCIILSAYSEFEYARSALLLGVENYLLKPIMQQELETTVEKALDNIYANRQSTAMLFRNNILSRWVNNNISDEELCNRAIFLDLNLYLNGYCVVCVRKRVRKYLTDTQINDWIGTLKSPYAACSFWDEKGHLVLIIGKNGLTQEDVTALLSPLAAQSGNQPNFIAAAGSIVDCSEKVPQSYQVALKLLETVDYTDISSPILTLDTCKTLINDIFVKELSSLFHIADLSERQKGFQEFAERLLKSQDSRENILSCLTHSLIQLFNQEFPQKQGVQKQIYGHIHLFSKLPAKEGLLPVILELLEYSYLLFEYYLEELSPVVRQAVSYIHENYQNGLSIKEFCGKIKMNETYLGYLFKKETGMFFNNYVTWYRILCALELLLETDLQVTEISRRTGFSSPSYFIASFKKQMGMSPIKYRALKHQGMAE